MIYVHGPKINLTDLRKIRLTRPQNAGKNWKGIPHGILASTLLHQVQVRHWKVEKQLYSVSQNGADLAGALQFFSVGRLTPPKGIDFCLGFASDNRMEKSLRLFVGGNIQACTNGLVTGEIVLKKRHTKFLDLTYEIEIALDLYMEMCKDMDSLIGRLKKSFISEENWSIILIETMRKRYVPITRLLKVDKLFHRPSNEKFGRRTSWDALQAFTEVVKLGPTKYQMANTNSFRQLLPFNQK